MLGTRDRVQRLVKSAHLVICDHASVVNAVFFFPPLIDSSVISAACGQNSGRESYAAGARDGIIKAWS